MTRDRRRMIIIIVSLALLGLGFWAAFFLDWARSYDEAAYFPEARFEELPERRQTPERRRWVIGSGSGICVLQISRGRTHSTNTSAHGWNETLTFEIPRIEPGVEYDLAVSKVRVGYTSRRRMRFWRINPGTVTGTLSIDSVTPDSVTASYDVTLTACYGNTPDCRGQEIKLKGTRLFRRSRHDNDSVGWVVHDPGKPLSSSATDPPPPGELHERTHKEPLR